MRGVKGWRMKRKRVRGEDKRKGKGEEKRKQKKRMRVKERQLTEMARVKPCQRPTRGRSVSMTPEREI